MAECLVDLEDCSREGPKHSRAMQLTAKRAERILPIFVLLAAIFLRLFRLDTVPGGLMFDEAWNGRDTLKVIAGEWPIFFTVNSGREALFIYLQAISVALLGQTSLALRVVSAILGIFTVVAAYLLTRRMFNARVALLTCGWLTISLWHVIFSRIGLRSISLPLFLAVGFYCVWRGLDGISSQAGARGASPLPSPRSAMWFALGGMVIGLSQYTYSTARFAPFVIIALAIYLAFLHRRLLRQALPGLILSLAVATIVFLPEGLFFLNDRASFLSRAGQIWVFNPELHEGNPLRELLASAIRSLGMFAIRGDGGWYYNISGRPIFDPLSALLMLIGIALVLRRFRQPAYGFIVIWLVVMFVPSLLAVQGTPNHLRATAIIPAIFILPALGGAWLWEAWESRAPNRLRQLPVLLVTLAFLVGTFHTFQSYFGLWAKRAELTDVFSGDRMATLQVARRMANADSRMIFVAGGDYYDPRAPFFLSGQPEARFVRTFDAERSIIFPADHASADYLLTWTPPHAPMMRKYFDEGSTRIIETAPSGRPITMHSLLDPRPPFEPEWAVPARFGEEVFVYGFDMPKDVRAGGSMTIRWYWRLLSIDQREFAFTNQLLGVDGQRRGQLDGRAFTSDYWPIGTSGISTFVIHIDPEAPTGAYWLHAAIYDQGMQNVSNLPIFDAEGGQAGNQLMLGPIKVHGRPPATVPAIEHHLSASFADQIGLLGYSLSDLSLVPGESLDLTLFWSPRGRPIRDYTVFIHLLDSQGRIQGQADSPPRAGKYPTSVWDAGETISDPHTISLRPDLPPGEYRLAIGLYDPETGQRLGTIEEDGKAEGDHVTISGLAVGG